MPNFPLRVRPKLMGFAVLTFLVMLLPLPTVGSSETNASTADIYPGAVMYANRFDVSLAEANERLARQSVIGTLGAQLANSFPESFAGLWIENAPTYRVVVATTSSDLADIREMTEESGVAQYVVLRHADYSLVELDAKRAAIQPLVEAIGFADVDIPANGLTVDVTHPLNLADAARAVGLPQDRITVRSAAALPREQTTLHGGGRLSTCTSGFSVWKMISGTKWKGITTAAHCGNSQSWVASGESLTFRGELYGNGYDTQWHTLPGQPNAATNQVFDGQSWHTPPYFQTITGYTGKQWLSIGQWICKYGKVTGFDCGQITNLNSGGCAPLELSAIRIHAAGVDLGEPGDSGYPWFDNSLAIATHSCGINGSGEGDSWAVGIELVTASIGVSLLTN